MSFDFLCSSASFLTLSAMSIERYKMLTTSYVHLRHSSKMRIIVFICLSWLLPFISWIPTVVLSRLFNSIYNPYECGLAANKYLILVLCILLYHIPLICMATFYTKLIVHIRKSLKSNLESIDNLNKISNNTNKYSHYYQYNVQVKRFQSQIDINSYYSNSMSEASPRHHLIFNESLKTFFKSNYVKGFGNNAHRYSTRTWLRNSKRGVLKETKTSSIIFPKKLFNAFYLCFKNTDRNSNRSKLNRNAASHNSAVYLETFYKNNQKGSDNHHKRSLNQPKKSCELVKIASRTHIQSLLETKLNNSVRESLNSENNDHLMNSERSNQLINFNYNTRQSTFEYSMVNHFTDEAEESIEQKQNRFLIIMSKNKDSLFDSADYRGLRYKRNRKAVRMLGLLVATFSICWLPFAIGYPLSQFFPNMLPSYATILIWWLGYTNSAINPFLYLYSNKNIR